MHSGVLGDTVERLSDRKSYAQLYPAEKLSMLVVSKGKSAIQNQVFFRGNSLLYASGPSVARSVLGMRLCLSDTNIHRVK